MQRRRVYWQASGLVYLLAVPLAAASPANLPSQIASDTTLSYGGSPYYVVTNTKIAADATVTVEAGVEVISLGNYELRVEGALVALGSEAGSVVFRPSVSGAVGAWQGIFITATGRAELTCAVIEGAQTNLTVAGGVLEMDGCYCRSAQSEGIFAFGNAYVRIVRCCVMDNGRRGLYVEGTDAGGGVWRTYFLSNAEYPVYAKATCAEVLKYGNHYESNGIQAIGVSCSALDDIADTDTWYDQDGLPYDLSAGTGSHQLAVSGVLNLDAGVTVQATDIDVTGTIAACGTAEQPVTILPPGANPARGDWDGITLRAGSVGNFSNAVLRFAANGVVADTAALSIHSSSIMDQRYDGVRCLGNTSIDIQDTLFDHNQRDGLNIEGWASVSPGVSNCRFSNGGRYPLCVYAGAVRLLGAGNVYQGNAIQEIAVGCHNDPDLLPGVHNWVAQGIPLNLTGRPDSTILHVGNGATLNIASGVKVIGGGINVSGTMNVQATLASPAYFDAVGAAPTPGDWQGIVFNAGSVGTVKGADIERAVHGLETSSSDTRIDECRIAQNEYDGLRVKGSAAPVVYNTWLVNNGRYGVYITGTAAPNLGNRTNGDVLDDGLNHIHDNASYEIYNNSPRDIYAQNNWWNTSSLAAVLADTYDYNDNPNVGRLIISEMRSYGQGGMADAMAVIDRALVITCASAQPLAGGRVQLSYRVSADSDVSVLITNIAGRAVAELGQKATADQTMSLLWNGCNAAGALAPRGRYLCIVCARTENGQSSRLVIPVSR